MPEDLAGREYWDGLWEEGELPRPVDPRGPGLNNYVARRFHRYFDRHFRELGLGDGARLLEVGCARSAWLPYFRREFGFRVAGLDYSEIGCRQARAVLARAGVEGEIVLGDLFDPPDRILGAFDVVVSFGVVEHFDDTAAALRAMARLLRPEGLLFVNIPNLAGVLGPLQRLLHRETYELHVPMDREALARAHREAGLEVVRCEYFLPALFGVARTDPNAPWWLERSVAHARSVASKLVWVLHEALPVEGGSRLLSPYVHALARKP